MVNCKFCDEEFENKTKMHYHWGEEHEDELNSHQKDKVKKARRKKEEERKQIQAQRKRRAGIALGGIVTVLLIGLVAYQILPHLTAGPDQQDDFNLEDRPVYGSADANVTIVEFGDYACPFCRDFEFQVKESLDEAGYFDSGDVNFYYQHYILPVDPFLSETAAHATECTAEQDHDEYWNFHTAILENQDNIGDIDRLMEVAEESTDGLDYDQLESCITSQDHSDTISADQSVARSNNVDGTPTVFINGERVPDPLDYSQVEGMIERELD